ncbi:hypothetical protein C7212DRAFT_346695 [Tuber magnatum]|uniref:BTB domain-containing protein n=1 Tax=Tuber magnatum TaxID=42249 RepID=A0A317SKL9_9PEZI|nr:hypothetical protein C7212DRAFT_346695 [Tuber magnatum]
MPNNSSTKHSPKYKDFLFDGTVTLYVGQDSKRMEIHKKLLASISPEFDKHVNNDMKEAIEGIIRLPDEGEEVFTLFTKWAYTGDYSHEDDTRLATKTKKSQWLSLHKHLQLCVFSDKFNIPTLKQLAESKFHAEIGPVDPKGKEDGAGLVLVIDYAYDNLPSSDPLLKFLAQYASWKLELLRGTAGFEELILARPEFLKELLMHLKGLSIKPTSIAPQIHPTHDRRERIFRASG